MKNCSLLLLLTLTAMAMPVDTWSSGTPGVQEEQKPLVVILLRHAEKVDDSADPELSEEGKQRADQLAKMLRDTNIDKIHSTDFKRTKSTAGPLAGVKKADIEIYNPRRLVEFAAQLKAAGGTHVVVGHSNTTPQLVELLGGVAGT